MASNLVVPSEKIAAFSSCMESQVQVTLHEKEEERIFQSQLRERMSSQLVPHACNDFQFNTTLEVLNRTWHYEEMEGHVKKYIMQVVHERPSSMIFFTPKFASTQECLAAVNSIDTNTNTIPWNAVDAFGTDGIILHNLSTKLYELARTALQLPTLNMKVDKTIESSSLFQVHQDNNDEHSKESIAECDATSEKEQGVCQVTTSSSPLLLPTKSFQVDDPEQLGTAFLFCNVPPQGGGAVHFPAAGIHINPEPGMLIFATHRQDKHELDGFVQEYHMCPHHNVLTHSFVPPEAAASKPSSNRPKRRRTGAEN